VVSFLFWLLYAWRKRPWYPLERRLGGFQSQSGHGGEKKNIAHARNKIPIIQSMDFLIMCDKLKIYIGLHC